MRFVHDITASKARRLEGVFFDLDDTFLCETRVSEQAYASLFRLRESGLRLVALTGRPAAWAELIAMLWPIEAAIAENGALGFRRVGSKVEGFDSFSAARRAAQRERLDALVRLARREIPELVPALDVAGRVSDYTFDIGEFHRASHETISRARSLAQAWGARTTVSSVHLHFTFDRADKATGALSYLRSRGTDSTVARSRYAFIGDSQNDAPGFAAFDCAVGVANLSGVFSIPPAYRTTKSHDAGFCEFAQTLCRLRD